MKELKYVEYERNTEHKLESTHQSKSRTIGSKAVKIKILNIKVNERTYWDKIRSKSSWIFLFIVGLFKNLIDVQ